jgi:hypothetical protein
MSDEENPLALVPTTELVNELLMRFDNAVFIGMRATMGNTENGEYLTLRRWRGNSHTCTGLAFDAAMQCNNDMHDHGERHDPDDNDVL